MKKRRDVPTNKKDYNLSISTLINLTLTGFKYRFEFLSDELKLEFKTYSPIIETEELQVSTDFQNLLAFDQGCNLKDVFEVASVLNKLRIVEEIYPTRNKNGTSMRVEPNKISVLSKGRYFECVSELPYKTPMPMRWFMNYKQKIMEGMTTYEFISDSNRFEDYDAWLLKKQQELENYREPSLTNREMMDWAERESFDALTEGNFGSYDEYHDLD
jgi:hypothetical protein